MKLKSTGKLAEPINSNQIAADKSQRVKNQQLVAMLLIAFTIGTSVLFVSCEKEDVPEPALHAAKSDSSALFKNATLTELSVSDSTTTNLKSASVTSFGTLMATAYNVRVNSGQIVGLSLDGKHFSDSYTYTAVASVKQGSSWVFFGALLNTNAFYSYFSNTEGTIGANVNIGQTASAAFKKPSARTNGNFYAYGYGYTNSIVDILIYRSPIPVCNPLDFTSPKPDSELPGNSCVSYVRAKVPVIGTSAKTPLNSYDEKKAACNVRDDSGKITNDIAYAKPGMLIVGPSTGTWAYYGHIAYLYAINSDGTITVKEGNSGGSYKMRNLYPDNRLYKDPVSKKTLYGFQCHGFINPCLIK